MPKIFDILILEEKTNVIFLSQMGTNEKVKLVYIISVIILLKFLSNTIKCASDF